MRITNYLLSSKMFQHHITVSHGYQCDKCAFATSKSLPPLEEIRSLTNISNIGFFLVAMVFPNKNDQ